MLLEDLHEALQELEVVTELLLQYDLYKIRKDNLGVVVCLGALSRLDSSSYSLLRLRLSLLSCILNITLGACSSLSTPRL